MKSTGILPYKASLFHAIGKRKIISMAVALIILSVSFSPVISGKELVRHELRGGILSKRGKSLREIFREKLTELAEMLVKRFPRLASLPMFKRLLEEQQDTSENSNTTVKTDTHEQETDDTIRNSETSYNNEAGSGSTDITESFGYTGSSETLGQEVLAALKQESPTDNSTKWVIPESGHLKISGNVSIEIYNGMFYVENHTILLSGKFYLTSEDDSIDIWWDLSRPFFKINGSRHFKIENLYFDVDGKLTVKINSILVINSEGYFMIDRSTRGGSISFSGVRKLSGVSVNIDTQKGNVTFSGSFDLTMLSQSKDFSISWNEKGFLAGGSYTSQQRLNIRDLYLMYGDYEISASLVSIGSTVSLEFKDINETTALCSIIADNLQISDLYLRYLDKSLFVKKMHADGSISLTLSIDGTGKEYVSSEEGHIVITGNTVMSINTTIDLSNTTVKLQGKFRLETSKDSIHIWWNKTKGYLEIAATSVSIVGDFHLSLGNDWMNIGWDNLVINSGGSITVDKIDNTYHLKFQGCVDLENFLIAGNYQNNSIKFSVDSLYFGRNGEVSLLWSNETGNLTVYAHSDFSLIIHNMSFSFAGINGKISTVILKGDWKLNYDSGCANISVKGSLKIKGFYVGKSGSTLVKLNYFSVSGSAYIFVGNGKIEIRLKGVHSSLYVGSSPLGPFSVMVRGNAHIVIDLETGEIYGEFGFGGYACIMGLGVIFDGQGRFHLANGQLDIWVSGSFSTSLSMVVAFHIDNLTISAAVGASVYGGYSLHISINLVTGKMSMGGGIGGVAFVSISNIRAYGHNINLDEHDWKDFGIDESSLLYSFKFHIGSLNLDTDGSIEAVVAFYMGLNGGFGFSISSIDGDLDWDLDIRDIKISSNPRKPLADNINLTLSIGSVDAKGSFSVSVSDMSKSGDISLKFSGTGSVEDIKFSITNSSSGGYLNASIGKISLNGEINLEMLNVLHGLSFGIYNSTIIRATTSIDSIIEDICIEGKAYGLLGKNISIDASIDLISLECGELEIYYSKENNGTLCIEGSGYLNIEGVSVNASIDDVAIDASLGSANFTLSGYVNIYGNGSVEAACEGFLVVEDIKLSTDEQNITIESINIEFGGRLKVIPGDSENDPPVFEVNGHVEWNITGDIESEGDVDVNGNVTIKIQNSTDGNITLIDIVFDGKVNMNISINGSLPGMGNFSIDLQNYSGDGMFEFFWNLTEGKLYMGNFVNATWDDFSFSIADGFIGANISHFYGDLTIENISIDRSLLENCSGEIGAIANILLSRNTTMSGSLDPDNWTIHSQHGYQTIFGFSFSSKTGLSLKGEKTGETFIEINSLYCAPGTEGRFSIDVDENGNFNISLITYSGSASVEVTLNYGGISIIFNITSEDRYYELPIGNILRVLDDVQDGEWSELVSDLRQMVSNLSTIQLLYNIFVKAADEYDTSSTLLDYLINLIRDILDEVPDYIRDQLEDILDQLEELKKNSQENSCFLKGTKIEMADGSLKNIEDIKVGDLVKSYDIESKEWKVGIVTKVFHHSPEEMGDYYLVINGELRITPNHPVYVDGRWITADELEIGKSFGGSVVYSIERIYRRVPTYNFEVEPYHTYSVIWGNGAISVVHNAVSEKKNASEIKQIVTGDKNQHKSCFLKGTKIEMADGSLKNIEDIKVGDLVKSYDFRTNKVRIGVVTKVFHHSPEEMDNYYLVLNHDLGITPNHPILVDGKWIKAEELKIGDVFGGNRITSIEKIYKRVPTYNFEVEPYHNYIVIWGNASSIVHNAMAQKNASEILEKVGISGDKYQSKSIKADAGAETKVEISKEMVVNGTKKIEIKKIIHVIPKTYENKKGEKVRVDDITVVVNEKGEYSIEKKQQDGKTITLKSGLKSSQEVAKYIEKSVVNKQQSSDKNNKKHSNDNNDEEDDNDDDDDNEESCCFPAGTMITMADGSLKPIEKVKVGDLVMSYDTKTGKMVSCRVLETVSPIRSGVYNINDGLIRVTDDHPFYVMKKDGRIGWAAINPKNTEFGYRMKVMRLEVGDKLFTQDGRWIDVRSIEYEPGPIQTYNLEDVSGKSTFFANGLLVHNAVQCKDSSEVVESNNNNDGGVSYSCCTGSTDKPSYLNVASFDSSEVGDENELSVKLPIEFDGSGTYIADKESKSGRVVASGITQYTKIKMADGTVKNIEDIKPGDIIKSLNLSNKELVNTRVRQVNRYTANDGYIVVRLTYDYNNKQIYNERKKGYDKQRYSNIERSSSKTLSSGYPANDGMTDIRPVNTIDKSITESLIELRIAPDTIIYVKLASGAYRGIPAKNLRPGYSVFSLDGDRLRIKSVQKINKKIEMYSIETDDGNLYFANSILIGDKAADVKESSSKFENEIVTYIWDFGDGTIGYGKKPIHTFNVNVSVDDDYDNGNSALYDLSYDIPIANIGDRNPDVIPSGKKSRTPWVSKDPSIIGKTTNGKTNSQPVYRFKEITYPVTLIAIDKYGRIGIDTTNITIRIPVPVYPSINQFSDIHYKSIEKIKVGERIKTVDLRNKKIINAKVVKVNHFVSDYYLIIKFRSESHGEDKVPKQYNENAPSTESEYLLKILPDHPVCVVTPLAIHGDYYRWIPAKNLKIGDVTYSVDGKRVVVTSIQKVYRRVDVYNLVVETYSGYFANGILVGASGDISGNTHIGVIAGTQVAISEPIQSNNIKRSREYGSEQREIMGYPNIEAGEAYNGLVLKTIVF